jgi:hypothetical protein
MTSYLRAALGIADVLHHGGFRMSGSVDPGETLIFVVRLWREIDTSGDRHWRGRVEQVASQKVGYVEDAAGVAHFIEHWTTGDEEKDRDSKEDKR